MKIDLFRKIVKFEDGRYGIRKWSMIGYRFLDLNPDDNWWWLSKNGVESYAKGTLDQVTARLAIYRVADKKATPNWWNDFDKGRPIRTR